MRKLSIVALLVGVASAAHVVSGLAQQPAAEPMPASPEAKETHQLPDGYAAVVTRGQRRRIYVIQDQYQVEIGKLQQQIDQLLQKRDQEVARILDDEQRRIIAYILKLRADERQQDEGMDAAADNANGVAGSSDTETAKVTPDPSNE